MNRGDKIKINAVILRVDGKKVDAQTSTGELLRTDINNIEISNSGILQQKPNHKAILNLDQANAVHRRKNHK